MFGGSAPGIFLCISSMARAYCWPRNTSSASFSRCDMCFQTGMATVIITAITLIATRRAAMA